MSHKMKTHKGTKKRFRITATGKIKHYQVVVGGVMLLNLPVSYIFLKLGFPPEVTMYIAIVIAATNLFLRLLMLERMSVISVGNFISAVLLRVTGASLIAYTIPLGIISRLEQGWLRFLIVSIVGVVTTISSIYLAGLSKNDKTFVKTTVLNKFKNKTSFRKETRKHE